MCADKRWDVALAYDDAGGITAVMPYLKGCRVGMRYILPPQLTPFTGPWYRYPSAALSERERLDFEEHAAQQLLDNIDRQHASVFIQCFSPQITNWLPFYHRGYKQTTRYTYRIDDISDTQCVFDMLTPHRRRKIRQWDGQVAFDVLSSEDAAWFADFHAAYCITNNQSRRTKRPQFHNITPCRCASRISCSSSFKPLILGLNDSLCLRSFFCLYLTLKSLIEDFD